MERSPPRLSPERPRGCAVNWSFLIRTSLRALPWGDFRDLERHVQTISALVLSGSSDPRLAWLSPWLTQFASATISVDGQRYTVWELRCEIDRRAMERLERP